MCALGMGAAIVAFAVQSGGAVAEDTQVGPFTARAPLLARDDDTTPPPVTPTPSVTATATVSPSVPASVTPTSTPTPFDDTPTPPTTTATATPSPTATATTTPGEDAPVTDACALRGVWTFCVEPGAGAPGAILRISANLAGSSGGQRVEVRAFEPEAPEYCGVVFDYYANGPLVFDFNDEFYGCETLVEGTYYFEIRVDFEPLVVFARAIP